MGFQVFFLILALEYPHKIWDKYLLLTEFESRTVSYGPSFFLLDLWLLDSIHVGFSQFRLCFRAGYMVSGTLDNPPPDATLVSVYIWKSGSCKPSQS